VWSQAYKKPGTLTESTASIMIANRQIVNKTTLRWFYFGGSKRFMGLDAISVWR